ncbi:MAG: tetratricopeptide repeat protein [Bacteroidales bacterium]|nr:tetratricopeptide repeat protein [Bacteroidales bacterium]
MKGFKHLIIAILAMAVGPVTRAQVNTDQVIRIGQNAMYFEDYLVAIQYFNLAIASRPDYAQPYFYRAIAKINLDDYQGAEADASTAIRNNPFIAGAYEVRGVSRQNMGNLKGAVEDYDHALRLLPRNRNLMFNRSLALQDMGDTVAARQSFNELLEAHPGYDSGYLGRARLYLEEGDTLAAIADINKSLEINSSQCNAYILRADIAINRDKDLPTALADMDQAIKLQPRNAGLYINRAFLRYRTDDFFGAAADYDYALLLDPLNDVALFNRGLLRAEVRDNDRAIKDFTQVLSLRPDDPRALYNRALLYRETGQMDRAMADINRVIELQPELPGAMYMRYEIHRDMGQLRQAERDYYQAVAMSKKLSGMSQEEIDKAVAAHATPEDEAKVKETAARFSSLLTLDHTDEPLERDFNEKGLRGQVQDRTVGVELEPMFSLCYYFSPTELKPSTYSVKEIDRVNATRMLPQILMISNASPTLSDQSLISQHFNQLKEIQKHNEETTSPRAIDLFAQAMEQITLRDYVGAETSLTRAIEITPDFALAWFQRGVVRAMIPSTLAESSSIDNQRQLYIRQALSDFDEAAGLAPTLAFAPYNKGVIYAQMGDYTSALKSFTDAIAIDPTLGEAWYNRGYAYLKLGNREAGMADISQAGELGIVPSYYLLKRMR